MDFAYVKTPTTTFSKERQRKKQSKKTKNRIPLFLLHYATTRYRASCPAPALDNLCETVLHVLLPARDLSLFSTLFSPRFLRRRFFGASPCVIFVYPFFFLDRQGFGSLVALSHALAG